MKMGMGFVPFGQNGILFLAGDTLIFKYIDNMASIYAPLLREGSSVEIMKTSSPDAAAKLLGKIWGESFTRHLLAIMPDDFTVKS